MPHRKPTEYDKWCGREIAALRSSAHKTQADVGDHVGITAQQISKYERGESSMTLGLYHEICAFLGRPPSTGFAEEQASYSVGFEPRIEAVQALEAAKDQIDQALRIIKRTKGI